MKWNRFYKYLCYLASGGLLLQATGCDSSTLIGIFGELAISLLLNSLLGGLAT
ncbi:MAG: hypothetical protein ACYTF1_22275 [Planctomycetota bacterium]